MIIEEVVNKIVMTYLVILMDIEEGSITDETTITTKATHQMIPTQEVMFKKDAEIAATTMHPTVIREETPIIDRTPFPLNLVE